MGLLLKWLYCCLDDFVAFHAEVCDKVLGQFLICVNMLVEIWGRAMLDILHSRIEGLPERRVSFKCTLPSRRRKLSSPVSTPYPLVRVVLERSTSEVR